MNKSHERDAKSPACMKGDMSRTTQTGCPATFVQPCSDTGKGKSQLLDCPAKSILVATHLLTHFPTQSYQFSISLLVIHETGRFVA